MLSSWYESYHGDRATFPTVMDYNVAVMGVSSEGRMALITEDHIRALVAFVEARVSEVDAAGNGAGGHAAAALRLVVGKQVSVIRYLQAIPPEDAAVPEVLATASWNLLVGIARVWQDHVDFPVGAAVETFDFESDHPLLPFIPHQE